MEFNVGSFGFFVVLVSQTSNYKVLQERYAILTGMP